MREGPRGVVATGLIMNNSSNTNTSNFRTVRRTAEYSLQWRKVIQLNPDYKIAFE